MLGRAAWSVEAPMPLCAAARRCSENAQSPAMAQSTQYTVDRPTDRPPTDRPTADRSDNIQYCCDLRPRRRRPTPPGATAATQGNKSGCALWIAIRWRPTSPLERTRSNGRARLLRNPGVHLGGNRGGSSPDGVGRSCATSQEVGCCYGCANDRQRRPGHRGCRLGCSPQFDGSRQGWQI